MTNPNNCAHCGSTDVMVGQDAYQCIVCGFHTDNNGKAMARPNLDQPTTWYGRRNVDGGHFDSQE